MVIDENMIEEVLTVTKIENLIDKHAIKVLCFAEAEAYEKALASGDITCIVDRSPEMGPLIIESIQKMVSNPYSPKAILNSNDVIGNVQSRP